MTILNAALPRLDIATSAEPVSINKITALGQVSAYLVIRGLYSVTSRQVRAHVLQTYTDSALPDQLSVNVSNSRP